MIRSAWLGIVVSLLISVDLPAQANWQQAADWSPTKAFERLSGTKVRPNWIEDSGNFWYPYLGNDGFQYWLVTSHGKTREKLFDRTALAGALQALTKTPHEAKRLSLENIKVIEGKVRFDLTGQRYEYDRSAGTLEKMEREEEVKHESWLNMAPDGKCGVFLRGNDLYIRTPDNKETRITFDGEKGLAWGADSVLIDNDDNEPRRSSVTWSGDSQRFCVYRLDSRQVEDLWLVDHLHQPRPALKTYKCPMPEDQVPQWELWVYDRGGEKMIRIDTDRFEDQSLDDLFIETLWWSKDSKTLYFTRRSRDYMQVDFCAADPSTGKSRILVEERLKGMVYIQPPVFLERSERLLWWSMRDGWGHYYLYDLNGNLLNQVTRGPWTVRKMEYLDERQELFYFMASGREEGRNPYYSHLYKVSLNGRGIKLLTPEDAQHQCSLSPSRRCFVDTYSRVDLPNRNVIRDLEGELLMELETTDISRLEEAGWRPPEIFSAKSADGVTDQWGVMYKPYDFSPEKRYPIITRVYPGRQSEFIPLEFYPATIESTLAQLGFIVVKYGNRGGCPERGLAYREYGRDDFRDYGLADKKAVIEELAGRHRWIDRERVGIVGGSSGGFMTVSAMLIYPDFFKVGVAMTSPNDPSLYYNFWAERYLGVKKVKGHDGVERWDCRPDGNIELAKYLKGRLLMINGAQDDNVHPAHLYRMADAFIRAGKRFDMFLVPGADHGLGDWRYLYGMIMDYFAEHLLDDRSRGVEAFKL